MGPHKIGASKNASTFNLVLNEGARPSVFELELPLSDICWKEKKMIFSIQDLVTELYLL